MDTPNYFSTKQQWQQVFDDFRVSRCASRQLITTTKRREIEINDGINLDYNSTDSCPNIVTPPAFRRRLIIIDIIGDYYSSMEGRLLFNTKTDETVYDCLSRQIDVFDTILNNKMNVSKIVKKGNKRDCELNSKQSILVYISIYLYAIFMIYLFI